MSITVTRREHLIEQIETLLAMQNSRASKIAETLGIDRRTAAKYIALAQTRIVARQGDGERGERRALMVESLYEQARRGWAVYSLAVNSGNLSVACGALKNVNAAMMAAAKLTGDLVDRIEVKTQAEWDNETDALLAANPPVNGDGSAMPRGLTALEQMRWGSPR